MPVFLALGAQPRAMELRVFLTPFDEEIPQSLLAHLAGEIAADGLEARALSNTLPFLRPISRGQITAWIQTGELSAHRRLAHMRTVIIPGLKSGEYHGKRRSSTSGRAARARSREVFQARISEQRSAMILNRSDSSCRC